MASDKPLSDFVEIKRQFLRSVNLEKDSQTNAQNGGYIITPTARQILRRISEGLSEGSTYRAWTITGPYGVGKSAFAVFLTKLLCNTAYSTAARVQLEDIDKGLAKDLLKKVGSNKGLLPIVITGRRAPAALCLTEGIRAAVSQIKGNGAKQLATECDSLSREIRKGIVTDSRRIVNFVGELSKIAQGSGYSGILFMVDELGKLFEFAARMPQKADVFVLQELAEQASRSGDSPVLFLGFLHQSFEEYGQHLDSLTRKEWAKIHGRFEDIAFLEPVDQVVRMVATAIKWTGEPLSPSLAKEVRHVAKACAENGGCPPGMGKSEFEEICLKAYPFHPMTLVALPYIFRRFAQNERSLFSYLSSLEPSGFQDFLRRHTFNNKTTSFLRLSHLFDYFTINFGSGLFRQPQARRWLEAADVLDRKDNLTPVHAELIKTIGVLGALGEFSNLSATEHMVAVSVCDMETMSAPLQEGLKFLQEQSILTYRRFNKTFRIWEGSDVDIDERVAEGARQLRGRTSLAASIQQYLPPRPLVARRHNFNTGALRYFSVIYLDDPAKVAENVSPIPGAAGQVLVCIPSTPVALQSFKVIAKSSYPERRDIVFAIPQQIGEIHSAVAELTALRWAWENTPELRDDRVARREVSLRIVESEQFLRRNLGALLDPREEPLGSECLWYWNTELLAVNSRTDVSQMLSTICDKLYTKTAWIRNELIARRIISSTAAAARRNLIEKMITSPGLPALGIDGYPPERSMYESVLRATGVHRTMAGKSGFFDPQAEKHGLALVWNKLTETIFESAGEPQALNTVFKMLGEAPYGVMDGISPVLLCAFIMAHSDEVTLFREGTFIPEISIADFEVLMRRPELFEIAGSRVDGFRAAVVERLAKSLGTQPSTIPVVRSLFRRVKSLPELAWKTKRLSDETIKLRDAFEKAKSPDKFLYVDLPVALGLQPFPVSAPEKVEVEKFFISLNKSLKEWSTIATTTRTDAKASLLIACGFPATDSGWQLLREVATKLEPKENDPVLLQFFRRIIQAGSDIIGVDSVLALVVNRPLENWADTEVDRFPELAKGLGDPIKRAIKRSGLGSGDSAGFDELTTPQKEKARSLAREFAKRLDTSKIGETPEVIRAAFLLLAEKIISGVESKK